MKRILSLLTCGAMILGTFSFTHASAASNVCGDADGNGSVNVADVILINKYLYGADLIIYKTNADTDGNKVIDELDAQIIMLYLAGKVNSLPYYGDGNF